MKIFPFTKTYEGRCVLDFPGMELQPGKIYAVIGANGSANPRWQRPLPPSSKRIRAPLSPTPPLWATCPRRTTPSA